ncbi:S8 family serine peptidase, partial [Pseudokineococcus marinus]
MSPSRPTPRTATAAVVIALVAAALAPVGAASATTPDGAGVEAVLAAAVPVAEVGDVGAAPATGATGGAGPTAEAPGPDAQGPVVVDVLRADGSVATVAAADAAAADELADEIAEQPGVLAADVATTYVLTGELAPVADPGPTGLEPVDLAPTGAAAAGDDVAWHLDDVRAPAAWRTTTGAGRVVAVLDSPVDAAHPDLAGALLPEVDLVVGEGRSDHGTFVTSLVVGRSAPGRATTGVAPSARVLPVEVCGDDGCTSSAVAEGIRRAVAARVDVINLSLAGRTKSTVVESAVRSALAAGIVVVAASGNDGAPCTATAPTACGNPVMYPAAVPGVVAVAASDASGRSAPWAVHGPQVALTAPGAGVVGAAAGGGYARGSGTSFAAPVVAGTAALVRSAAPSA